MTLSRPRIREEVEESPSLSGVKCRFNGDVVLKLGTLYRRHSGMKLRDWLRLAAAPAAALAEEVDGGRVAESSVFIIHCQDINRGSLIKTKFRHPLIWIRRRPCCSSSTWSDIKLHERERELTITRTTRFKRRRNGRRSPLEWDPRRPHQKSG